MRRTFNSLFFKHKLEDRKLTQRQVAQAIGRHPSQANRLFSGERKLHVEDIPVLAQLLGCTTQEIAEAAGIDLPSDRAKVAIAGTVGADGRVHLGRPNAGPRVADAPPATGEDVAAFLVTTGHPGPFERALLFASGSVRVDTSAVGRISICRLPGDVWMVRIPVSEHRAGRWTLLPFAGLGAEINGAEILSAAPVEWIRLA
jgi:transcriptional regulator with XRE-family HTH domain